MRLLLTFAVSLLMLSACSEIELGSHIAKNIPFPSDAEKKVGSFKVGNPYRIKGRTYYPKEKYQYSETGIASWYGPGFHGKLTANGEIFNKHELTAAHRTLQMPSIVRVTNLNNGRSIIVRINDRGPFAHNRIIDLSEKAASILGMIKSGTARVRVDVMEKESRQVAQAAREGRSTRGTEIALNRGKTLDEHMPLTIAKPTSKPVTKDQVRLAAFNKQRAQKFDSILIRQANAAQPVRKPATSMPNIFVETANFSTQDDALTMKMGLNNMIEPKTIYQRSNGHEKTYSVKIGPVSSQRRAEDIVQSLNAKGRSSKIVVVQR